jgi:hypothetical protein
MAWKPRRSSSLDGAFYTSSGLGHHSSRKRCGIKAEIAFQVESPVVVSATVLMEKGCEESFLVITVVADNVLKHIRVTSNLILPLA